MGSKNVLKVKRYFPGALPAVFCLIHTAHCAFRNKQFLGAMTMFFLRFLEYDKIRILSKQNYQPALNSLQSDCHRIIRAVKKIIRLFLALFGHKLFVKLDRKHLMEQLWVLSAFGALFIQILASDVNKILKRQTYASTVGHCACYKLYPAGKLIKRSPASSKNNSQTNASLLSNFGVYFIAD